MDSRKHRWLHIFSVLFLTSQLAVWTACFSYRATVSLEQATEPPERLSVSEIRLAADAVARSVEGLGLVADPRLDRIRRESQESEEIDNVVISLHKTNTDLEAWIEVRSVRKKDTGEFFVLIEDRQSPFASSLTREIEAAVTSALKDEFPSREIQFEDRVVGPSLGP